MEPYIARIFYTSIAFGLVVASDAFVDKRPRASRALRIAGFVTPLAFLLLDPRAAFDFQIVLTAVSVLAAIGISLHAEGYYRTIYGLSRYFVIPLDILLLMTIMLYSSYTFLEIIVYWFLIGIITAFIAIPLERGEEGLGTSITYLVMCVAPSDIALLTIWGVLASRMGFYESLITPLPTLAAGPIPLGPLESLIIGLGMAAKLGQAPLHTWVPKVYGEAPTHVSAALSGIIVKMGIFALLISANIFSMNAVVYYVLLAQAIISTIYGSMGAVIQSHLKRLLAYSSISYYGTILMLFAINSLWREQVFCCTPIFYVLMLAVIVFHTLVKSLGFLNVSFIYQVANTYDIYRLGYLSFISNMLTLSAFTAVLNLTGAPPSAGFVVKAALILASFLLAQGNVAALPVLFAVVISAVFSIAYSMKFMSAYTASLPSTPPRVPPLPREELAAEIYLGALTMAAPLPLVLTLSPTYIWSPTFVYPVIALYAISLAGYIYMTMNLMKAKAIPEQSRYWLAGVEA